MTLLFGDESVRPIAVVKPVSSSFFSLLVHFAVIAVLLAINFSAGVLKLPQNLHATLLVAPAPPLAPPPAGVAATRVVRRTPSKFVLPATVAIPKLPATQELAIADAPPELEGGAVPGRVPVAYRVVCQAVQVSGEIQEAKLLVMINPVYPRLALSARIQGAVRVAAIIDKDGKIAELKVVEGNPFLVDAALDSIKKWRYRPTLLSAEPVEVATQIIVHFRLNN